MCGRARCTMRPDDIPRACHLNGRHIRHVDMNRFRPAYNVSPGFNLPVVRREDGHGGDGDDGQVQQEGAVIHCMKWGLIPSFTKKTQKSDHYMMLPGFHGILKICCVRNKVLVKFNARSESLREKASFRRLIPNNRCLVTFEGFYEWKKEGSKRQPYYIYFKDGRPLVLAALYDTWKNAEGEIIFTFTIVTTSSSPSLEWLHDRMPVILSDKESTDLWLIGPASANFDTILKPYGESDLVWHPVTTAMGKPSFDGPECINEIQLKRDETRTISQFFSKKGVNSQKELKSGNRNVEEEPASMKEEHETEVKEIFEPEKKEEFEAEVKKELETEDVANNKPIPKSNESDAKPAISNACSERITKIPAKRESEVLSDDKTHSIDASEKSYGSPLKKKSRGINDDITVNTDEHTNKMSPAKPPKAGANLGRKKAPSSDDKQPTIFSYFGKG